MTKLMNSLQRGVPQMNDTFNCGSPKHILGNACLMLLLVLATGELRTAQAQPPQPGMAPVNLPGRPQYYEYLPRGDDWDRNPETPLERLLKQAANQSYTRFEYLNWSVSDPSQGHVGAQGKRLDEGLGFKDPAYIDTQRAASIVGFDDFYPIRNPLLRSNPGDLVLIQVWESTQLQLQDAGADGFEYDYLDTDANGVVDTFDDNDLDIFPRLTGTQKLDFFRGTDTNLLVPTTAAANIDAFQISQVAVLTVGRLANTRALQLDNNNGFRGLYGLNTTFGAFEASFFTMGTSTSGFEYVPLPDFLLGTPGAGAGGAAADPLVIPILVNDMVAPDVFDDNGTLITDSNNYYLVFNDTYRLTYKSEAWGFSPSLFWTLQERPDRFRISGSAGFQYMDLREQMLQVGTFAQTVQTPNRPFYVYNNELADGVTPIPDSDVLTSTINSVTSNKVMGPTAGIRTEVGDDRFSFGLDTKLMLGVNAYEAEVGVDDLLFVGDDNLTRDASTDFSAGFEMILDTKIRLRDHVTLTAGYNFLWFSGITRPDENIYYNIDATLIPLTDPRRATAAPDGPNPGPDYDINNDVVVRKEETTFSLSGLSIGVVIDW
ncbi:MAG: BBP7 family outer membrane beta-barrel protein [Planctomycetaceae bacterium]|nr:BBP7 family outer membrane beta-barrel protein [Planctomycetaceae bacterium]